MTDIEIREALKRFEERIFHMKASEAETIKAELEAFVKKYNVTTEQSMEFAESGAGELLYMLTS